MEKKDDLKEKKIRFEEKRDIFVADFNTKIAEIIKKTDESIANYTKTREEAIKLKDPIDLKLSNPDVEFKTVGELFAWVYYKEGSERIPMEYASIIMPLLGGRDASDESKAAYKTLHKTWSAYNRKNFYEKLNELGGGLAWFEAFMNSVFSPTAGQANLRVSDYANYDNFEDVAHIFEEKIPANLNGRPQGVLANLHAAFLEYEPDTPKKSEEKPAEQPAPTSTEKSAPINEQQTAEPPPKSTSSINEGEKGKPSPEKSVINPNPVKPAESENIEKTSGTVIAANPTIPVEVKEEVKPSPINVDVTVPEQPPVASTPATSSAINESSVSSQSTTNVSNVSNNPVNVDATTNNKESASTKSEETIKQFRQILEKAKASKSSVNDLTTTSVKNKLTSTLSDKLKSSSETSNTSESSSVINEKTVSAKKKPVIPDEAMKARMDAFMKMITLNSEKIKSSFTSNEMIGTSSEEKNNLETNTTQPNIPTETSQTSLEVSKTSPMFTEKTKENSSSITEKTNTSVKEVKPEVSVTPVSSNTETPAKPAPTPEPAGTSVNIDMSMLEQRLSRIEYLLSGTLDVKIVN